MLSRFSSVSGKRPIISFLQKFLASIQSKSASKLASIQHLGSANFSSSNNLNSHAGVSTIKSSRAYSTNYFKPISQQNKANNQHQDKIITMLRSTDSFVQTLEMLDSFWSQCSDSNKSNGLFRLTRLHRERFQIRQHTNRNRVKGLLDKIIQDIKQIQFTPKQLTQIQEFVGMVQQNFPYMINQKQLEDFSNKIKEAIDSPRTQFHVAMILFSKSGPFKSNQIVQSFWKKTLQNQQDINVTPRLTVQDTVHLFRVYSDLSSKHQLKRNDYSKIQNQLVESMQNFQENDVIDILHGFTSSKGRIVRELPQNLYKFLNLGIKHNSNTYSYMVIQRLIYLIPQMTSNVVKPNKQFINSLFSYIMSRSNNQFNTKTSFIGQKMISSLTKIAYQYQLEQPQIAHFLLDSTPNIRLSFCKIDQIQELTLCLQKYISNQIQDKNLQSELKQNFTKEFMKLSSNKENPAQGDFIKRIMIANILRQNQAEKQRIEEYRQFIQQVENGKFLLDIDVVKFMISRRYMSQESMSLLQLIFSKNQIFEAFYQSTQLVQWSIFLIMNNREHKDVFSQTFKGKVLEYFQNMPPAKQFRMLRVIFGEKRYHLINENILNETFQLIKRIEKTLEENRGQNQQHSNFRIQFLELLNSFYLRSRTATYSKRYIIDFINKEIASSYSKFKMKNKLKVFNVLRNFVCPQSMRSQIAQQFQKSCLGDELAKLNAKSIGFMIQEYTNHLIFTQSLEQKSKKIKAFFQFLTKFAKQFQQLNDVLDNQEPNQQRKMVYNKFSYFSDKEYIIQNCLDVQTSLGKLRRFKKEQFQRSSRESEDIQNLRKNLSQIEGLIKVCEDFYLHVLKFDNPNNQLLSKFLGQILEMDSNSWVKYQSDTKYRQQFIQQLIKKNQGMSVQTWSKIFQKYQKIESNWNKERFYNLKHFADPRKNLMNEFARAYQSFGAQMRQDMNTAIFRLLSIGKVKNTVYLNSFLSNFGNKYQNYSQSQLLQVAESLGQFGLVRNDIFQKLSSDIIQMKNKNVQPLLINNLIAIGARNMSFDQDWLKRLAEHHTKQVFQFLMSNDALDTNLATFLETAYFLFNREGFSMYEDLIPKVFQKFTRNAKNTHLFNRSFSSFFVHRLSQNTNYLPQNLRIPDLKMQHAAKEQFTLKNKFAMSNQKEAYNIFRSDLVIRNYNLGSSLLQALNLERGEQEKIGRDEIVNYKDKTDIYVPSKDLGIVNHGMKDYCFDGSRANNYHFLRHQEALSSNCKNIVFIEYPDYRKISSKENLISYLSAKLSKKEQ